MNTLKRWIEAGFETFLFNARLIVILAVLGSLASSVMMFIRGAVVIAHTAKDFVHHVGGHEGGEELSIALISSVDSFLFATVLLIFAMGIYELFISKIDPASRTAESRPNWLAIHSLDDLKGAVGKVILMILIVRLFESAVKMKYEHPLHLLYLGLAVLFVAVALYLQHLGHKNDAHHKEDEWPAAEHSASAPPASAPPASGHGHAPAPFAPAAHAAPAPAPFVPAAHAAPVHAAPAHPSAPPPYAPAPGQSHIAPALGGYTQPVAIPSPPAVPGFDPAAGFRSAR